MVPYLVMWFPTDKNGCVCVCERHSAGFSLPVVCCCCTLCMYMCEAREGRDVCVLNTEWWESCGLFFVRHFIRLGVCLCVLWGTTNVDFSLSNGSEIWSTGQGFGCMREL